MAKSRPLTKKKTAQRAQANEQKAKAKKVKGQTASKKQKKADDPERKNPITITLEKDGTVQFHGRSLSPTVDKNRALKPLHKQLLQYGITLLMLPSDTQAETIRQTNGCVRFVKRDFLETRQEYYNQNTKTLPVNTYKHERLQQLKKEKPWLAKADKFSLEAAVEQVDDAYEHFFKDGFGFPKKPSKYKPSGNRYTTKYTNGNIRLKMKDGLPYIQLPKVNDVRFVLPKHRTFEDILPHGARITKATVIKDGKNYLVSLSIEMAIDEIKVINDYTKSDMIAMDMGLKYFCDYGKPDGERIKIDNPRWIKLHTRRLRRLQQALSRKQYSWKKHKGSKNYYKAKDAVAKEQRKIANQRKDFQHKLSYRIANTYKVFICEDLNIKGLMKNSHLAKSIASVGWGTFLSYVKYKIERRGGIFLKVSRFFPSSKLCHHCSYKNDDMTLNDRYWICPECHTLIDRDDNAVDNLLTEGKRLLAEKYNVRMVG